MLKLTGEFEHVIDSKGRVLISNKLRNLIDVDKHGGSFYLVFGANGVLCLYPEKQFELMAVSEPRGAAPDESVAFERIKFALSSRVELDRQGRLLLNERLRRRARLKDKITLVGVRDHIELWNSEDWDRYVEDNMSQYQQQITQVRQVVLQNQIHEEAASEGTDNG